MGNFIKSIIVGVIFSNLFIFGSFRNEPKDFEGIIMFRYTYESYSQEITENDLINFLGDTSIVLIKGGKYKHIYPNSRGITEVCYDNNTNRYYFLYSGIDTLYYFDAGVKSTKYKTKKCKYADTLIHGYNCKKLVQTSQNDTTIYYYTPDLPLSYKPFKNHKYGGYNILTKQMKSVYLSMININEIFKCKMDAFYINEMSLSDALFFLPDLPIVRI